VGKNRLAFRFVCAFLIVISVVIPVSSADTEEKTALPDQAGPVPQGPLSLKEAIDIADAGNLDLAMATHRIEGAAASHSPYRGRRGIHKKSCSRFLSPGRPVAWIHAGRRAFPVPVQNH